MKADGSDDATGESDWVEEQGRNAEPTVTHPPYSPPKDSKPPKPKLSEQEKFQQKYRGVLSQTAMVDHTYAIAEAEKEARASAVEEAREELREQLPIPATAREGTLAKAEKRLFSHLDRLLSGDGHRRGGWDSCGPPHFEEWEISYTLQGLAAIEKLRTSSRA